MSNLVKIVCPCCHGKKEPCATNKEYCEGLGYIHAVAWPYR